MIRKLYRYTQYAAIATGLAAVPMVGQACPSDPLVGSVCFTAINFCPYGYFSASGQTVNIQSYAALYSLLGTKFGGDGKTTFGLPDLRGRAPIGANDQKISSGGVMISPTPLATLRGQESVVLATSQVPLQPHTHPATFTATTGQQQVTIPSTTGANLTLSGNLSAVPAQAAGTGNNFTPAAGATYRLAGAKGVGTSAITGPYSTDALPATPALVSGISVDASAMTPNIPAKNVNITTVTGGTVAVGAAGAPATAPVPLVSPQQALTACIAVNGIFPTRP
ncbi:MAG: tail fiber protein [Azonexus sp.]|nr:tail fiber protein [Azonexus sp.]MCK6412396.1 tail fiber protein [Azonexus sp.]